MIAFQLVSLVGLTCMAAFGLLAASALSFMAWLTVLAVLFLQGSDSFLALKNVPHGMVSARSTCIQFTMLFA